MIEAKVYKMAAKLKKNNKQVNESVIKRGDFLEVLQEINPNYGQGISDETLALIQPLL